ncbi:endonuclease [Gemmata sp.]|uniref:endonuclease n=1 Tax=Gemmata sp. TaxID=1914242 RepID=UPI003F72739D
MFLALVLIGFAATGESQLTLKPGWKATGERKSDHATQAAAADETRVFAVSSTTVAAYDRATGKLIGSAGGATHLNSAFVLGGKVYCAHSNYPKTPETSDIRVFDPEANTLSVFHEFKNPPGSLVWNVHDGKHWWCCFAHYGADNAKTLLIRYSDGFKEDRRWTFPKAVVDDWDKMSASGGVFDGATLLVTHHHFKVLYRLKVPKDGKELELLEALTCPFPGQGIGTDPKTGGLVGIDRAAKKVVFAAR